MSNLISNNAFRTALGGSRLASFSGEKRPAKLNVSGVALLYLLGFKILQSLKVEVSGTITLSKVLGRASVIYAPPVKDLSIKHRLYPARVSLLIMNTFMRTAGCPEPGLTVLNSTIIELRGPGTAKAKEHQKRQKNNPVASTAGNFLIASSLLHSKEIWIYVTTKVRGNLAARLYSNKKKPSCWS
ncbi:MAG: hypothetical protein L0Z48_09205 [candidate division Zixibacteria bacterium]|nr:hypothetical protein [candidate division Zixibacteria bacterium]MCI0596699.1 hypothetical protein [candidate division Zixibacteria bacterium]